jgi:ectoine hydroxylase-related dioxygenase (phytanoyl-CoA dioxygenase family)
MIAERKTHLEQCGYAVLPAVFAAKQLDAILQDLSRAFAEDETASTLRAMDGSVYGARNLLQLWPPVIDTWKQSPLPELLAAVLGPQFGLVRVLYFDKPPEQSWALPWHRDETIAVKNNRLPSTHFGKPTKKIGVPHVQAPRWLLEKMLTLRLHLDDVTEANGPLKVVPGSHHNSDAAPVTILRKRGDVLLMRPLLSHASNKSHPETNQHRRILHYEFAGVEELPDGYRWHDFVRARTTQ